MGQCYAVSAKLRFSNPLDKEAARQTLVKCVKDELDSGSRFDLVDVNGKGVELFDSFEGVMNVILSNQDFKYDGKDRFDSYFDASYGWESFLGDCFHRISPFLTLDSCMAVYPDSGLSFYRANGHDGVIYCDISPFFDGIEELYDHLDCDGDLYNSKRRIYIKKVDDNIYALELSEDEAKKCIDDAYYNDRPWSEIVSYLPKSPKKMNVEEFEDYYNQKDFDTGYACEEWVPAEPLTKVLLEGVA